MTTQQIADRLVELCRTGKSRQAYRELFAENAKAIDPAMQQPVTEGLENLLAKDAAFEEMVIELHELRVGDPIVADQHFACTMYIDITTERGRNTDEEICVYQVKDGKIVLEQFFYTMPEE